jgi:hypothetical protein
VPVHSFKKINNQQLTIVIRKSNQLNPLRLRAHRVSQSHVPQVLRGEAFYATHRVSQSHVPQVLRGEAFYATPSCFDFFE